MPRKLATDRMIPERRYKPAKMPTDLYFVQTECSERHAAVVPCRHGGRQAARQAKAVSVDVVRRFQI